MGFCNGFWVSGCPGFWNYLSRSRVRHLGFVDLLGGCRGVHFGRVSLHKEFFLMLSSVFHIARTV